MKVESEIVSFRTSRETPKAIRLRKGAAREEGT